MCSFPYRVFSRLYYRCIGKSGINQKRRRRRSGNLNLYVTGRSPRRHGLTDMGYKRPINTRSTLVRDVIGLSCHCPPHSLSLSTARDETIFFYLFFFFFKNSTTTRNELSIVSMRNKECACLDKVLVVFCLLMVDYQSVVVISPYIQSKAVPIFPVIRPLE